eukprot:m.249262 g.249262  ORF g.249262 m.249262 type:complete len:178 (+) comp15426_c0_seq12:3903-4436(+)
MTDHYYTAMLLNLQSVISYTLLSLPFLLDVWCSCSCFAVALGTWLSVGDVIMGMAVVHPHTPHKGAWLRVRGGALFRAYSTNSRTMSKEQLYTFVSDCLRHHPDGTARLAHTRKQYRGAARIGLTGTTDRAMHLTHEIMASICGVDAQQALSQSQFVNELLAGRLPECSLLLRFKVA